MPKKKDPNYKQFHCLGEHAAEIVRWCLSQAQEAVDSGIPANHCDIDWEAFKAARPDLVKRILTDHPSSDSADENKPARENYKRQEKRFKEWLVTGDGGWNSINFLRKTGLLGSTLAGTCTELPDKPGNDSSPPGDEADIPIADDDDEGVPVDLNPELEIKIPPTPKPPSKTVEEKLDELTKDCARWNIFPILPDCDMQLKVAVLKDVAVQGQPFDVADIFVVQAKVGGGCDLSRFDIDIDEDRCGGTATCPMDAAVSKGSKRIKEEWVQGNYSAAKALANALHRSCRRDVMAGTDHEVDKGVFSWPSGHKSQPVMMDPYDIGFRSARADLGKTLFEIEKPTPIKADLEGITVVPFFLVTAFYYSNDPAAKRETGDLRLPKAKKVEKKKKRRFHDDDSMEIAFVEDASDDDDGDDFGGAPAYRATVNTTTRKKAPMSSLNAALGGVGAAVIGMIAYLGMK